MELETKGILESTSGVALDNTLGAVFVSVIVSASLFGILTTQCYYYALRFEQDPPWLKCIVATLWIIDGTHQIAVSVMIFQYSVHHYGDLKYIRRLIWPVSVCIMLEPLPAVIVHMYFTRRLYLLNPKLWPIAALTAILSVITFVLGEVCAVLSYILPFIAQGKEYTWLVTMWLMTCSVCDIAVTIPVAWTLYTSRTAFKETNVLLMRLTLWTVNTGALPASFALLEFVMFIARNETLVYLAANIMLAKLYSNTLLAFLNRRGTLTTGEALHFSDRMLSLVEGNHAQELSSETGPRPRPSFQKTAGLKEGWAPSDSGLHIHTPLL